MNWVLAIDIGNSSVVAAVTAADAAAADASGDTDLTSVVPLGQAGADSDAWMPAAVFLTPDTVYTGRQAIVHAADNPQAFARSPKRFVGTDNPRAVELFSTILEQVRRVAAVHVGKRSADAGEYPAKLVLTHPAAWPSSAREVLKDAAVHAGFDADTVVLVSEPIAAAHSVAPKYRNGYLLVLDVGGGTCDVAVVDAQERRLRVLADGGENTIGGNNFDLAIMDLMRQLAIDELGELPEEYESDSGRIEFEAQARRVREQLSQAPDASFIIDGEDFLLTRDEFEAAIAPDIERIRTLIEDKLGATGRHGSALSGLLVGGTVRTPAIAAVVQESMDVLPMTDPISAVAVGAAAYGRDVLAEEEATRRAAEIERSTKKSSRSKEVAEVSGGTGSAGGHGGSGLSSSVDAAEGKRSGGFFSSQKNATRVGAVVAGLVIAAAATFFFLPGADKDGSAEGGGGAQSAPAAGQTAQASQLHTYPNVDIGTLKATVIEDDAPAFKDGYLSCGPMVEAATKALGAIDGFPGGTPYTSSFGGSSECRFDGNDPTAKDTVTVTTDSPAGETFALSRAVPVDDSVIGHWYELKPSYEGEASQMVVYVKDFGWITVQTNSAELGEQGVLREVAKALDAQLHLRRA